MSTAPDAPGASTADEAPTAAAEPDDTTKPDDTAGEDAPQLPLLAEPADGVPAVVDTDAAFAAMLESLAGGTGPVAVDAERAQAYRYSARAYLLQLRRAGSGTHLVDPLPFAERDWAGLGGVIGDAEWVIHAASQDTPSLAKLGLVPSRLFDTELAGRLLGKPRVGLGALIEETFGLRLAKEHSMADWSARPLPEAWLNYAALDVELLVELRDRLTEQLAAAGRTVWAEQEFAHLAARAAVPAEPRTDPWRRTAGIHQLRTPAQLAVVRELWLTRDELARRYDKAPGKIVADKAITELAADRRPGRAALRGVDGFKRRMARRFETNWLQAIERALALPPAERPPVRVKSDALPPPRSWARSRPEAYTRWLAARDAINALAGDLGVPAENLITPAHWRRVAWAPPEPADATAIAAQLEQLGARPWQRDLVAPALAAAFERAD